jgi:hypothetical protein
MRGAPALDVFHVQSFRALHGQHDAGVVEVLAAALAEFVHHHPLGFGSFDDSHGEFFEPQASLLSAT